MTKILKFVIYSLHFLMNLLQSLSVSFFSHVFFASYGVLGQFIYVLLVMFDVRPYVVDDILLLFFGQILHRPI